MEYVNGEQETFLHKCSHVEYKQLKKVLKSCRSCKALGNACSNQTEDKEDNTLSQICQCDSSCPCKPTFPDKTIDV